jgi:hypothetical protein
MFLISFQFYLWEPSSFYTPLVSLFFTAFLLPDYKSGATVSISEWAMRASGKYGWGVSRAPAPSGKLQTCPNTLPAISLRCSPTPLAVGTRVAFGSGATRRMGLGPPTSSLCPFGGWSGKTTSSSTLRGITRCRPARNSPVVATSKTWRTQRAKHSWTWR